MESNGHDPGEWITLAEARERSGLSIDALRRRLKRGQLPARQEQTRHGPTWLVDAEALPSASTRVGAAPTVGARVGAEAGAAMLALVEQNRELHAELLRRTEAATAWQARAEMLAGQLADLREHVRALETPKVEQTTPEPSAAVEPASEPQTRPWWRRWFGS